MSRRFVYFQGKPVEPGIIFKSLLQTGTESTGFQFWVAGDRSEPFGPLPELMTNNPGIRPQTIQATGPGINDWVVCYASATTENIFNGGPNLAFADNTGIIATRQIIPPPGPSPFLGVTSKGNFASYRVGTANGNDIVQGWSTPVSQQTETVPVSFLQISNFVLPDVFVTQYANAQGINLSRRTSIDPVLSHAVHQRTTSPVLYFANNTFVNVSPSIPGYSPFSSHTALSNLVLYQADNEQLSADFLASETGDTVAVTVTKWQIETDGTWTQLDPVSGNYFSANDHFRLDVSFYPI